MPTADAERPLSALLSLAGRRAVITGAARGIGYATARRFAEAGAVVMLGDLDAESAAQAAAAIASDHGATIHSARLDVSKSDSVAAFADHSVRRMGGIDIWVNNAGVYPATPMVETSDEFWTHVIDVNLKGAFHGCREAAKRMIDGTLRPGRVIVNIASVAALRGRVSLTTYSAAKSGVLGLTRSAAMELAPHRIRVLAVTPSMAETPGVRELREAARGNTSAGSMLATMERDVMASFPLGRAAEADEVARVVLFCASDMAAFMTGSNILVDGGLTTR
ncbi:MAG: SDR family NAD(P)-dependent oxidoreductase [Rhodospirillales bacterium]|nr:SDR family NAD(P)-dependent oxidoreductase [Rhodospirillales bacterium]